MNKKIALALSTAFVMLAAFGAFGSVPHLNSNQLGLLQAAATPTDATPTDSTNNHYPNPGGGLSVTTSEAAKVIDAALAASKSPELKLDSKTPSVNVPAASLEKIAEAGKDLILVNGNATAVISDELIKKLPLNDDSVVNFKLAHKELTKDQIDKIAAIDPVNKDLAKLAVEVSASIDKTAVAGFAVPIAVTVDLSGYSLTDAQKAKLTGVYFDATTNTYKQIGGELSKDGKKFTYFTPNAGLHGVIVSNKITKIVFTINSEKYTVNGVGKTSTYYPRILENDRAVLPLRNLSEALGATVDWDGKTRTATISLDGEEVIVKMDESLPNGMGTPRVFEDRMFVPTRYVSEELGATVVWDDATKTITIYR